MHQIAELKLNKISITVFALIFLAQILLAATPVLASAHPIFNNDPQDLATLRLKNRTQGDTIWQTSVSADPGDRIAFDIYYHNTVFGSVANNTKIKIVFPSTKQSPISVAAYISADNADTVDDNANIYINTPERLIFDDTALWYPNQTATGQAISVSKTSNSVEVNIGDIQGCWQYQGHVVFEAVLSETATNPILSIGKFVQNISAGQTYWSSSIQADPLDRLAFKIEITSTGDVAAEDVFVKDVLPPEMSYLGNLYIDGIYSFSDITSGIYLGDLSPGQSKIITFQARVAPEGNFSYGISNLTNRVKVDAQNVPEKEDTVSVYVERREEPSYPDLSVSKYVKNISRDQQTWHKSIQADPSDKLAFKIRVVSSGDTTVRNVRVKDVLPSKISYQGNLRINGVYSLISILAGINLGSLSPGQSKTITFEAKVNPEEDFDEGTTSLTNRIRVYADNVPEKEDTASVRVVRSALSVQPNFAVKKLAKNISQGQQSWHSSIQADPLDRLAFKIEITSTGNVAAEDVFVKDVLPEKMFYLGNLKVDGVSSMASVVSGINIGDLAPRETKTITYETRVYAGSYFSYGQTKLINTALAYNQDVARSDSLTVTVSKKEVAGAATEVETGFGNKILDYLLVPLVIALVSVYLFRKQFFKLSDWLEKQREEIKRYRAQKVLNKKIFHIRKKEGSV